MSSEAIVAIAGFIGLGVASLSGALWDTPLINALFRRPARRRSSGRHAMPR